MKTCAVTSFLLLSTSLYAPLWATISQSDRQQMDRILPTPGIYTPSEDTYRVLFPRTDVRVAVNGRGLSPFSGLVSWAALTSDPHHGGALLLAEWALVEDEVNPVLSVALDNQLEITALNSHFLFEKPRVLYMRVAGFGEPPELAAKLRRILDKIKAIRRAHPKPTSRFESGSLLLKSNITASVLDSILATHGQTEEGMYKASMGMRGMVEGIPAGKQMGLSTWIAISGTNERAVVDGEIVMTRSQIQDVLRALVKAGIEVTALDHPMVDDHPEFFFVHYWGEGQAAQLARAVRSALETQLGRGGSTPRAQLEKSRENAISDAGDLTAEAIAGTAFVLASRAEVELPQRSVRCSLCSCCSR